MDATGPRQQRAGPARPPRPGPSRRPGNALALHAEFEVLAALVATAVAGRRRDACVRVAPSLRSRRHAARPPSPSSMASPRSPSPACSARLRSGRHRMRGIDRPGREDPDLARRLRSTRDHERAATSLRRCARRRPRARPRRRRGVPCLLKKVEVSMAWRSFRGLIRAMPRSGDPG